jgi:HaeIII restriction endonuclease
MEPKLANGIDKKDILQLEIVSDVKGQSGDVRDVLAIRSSQKWEIGISAKNNHRAVKHSRLSSKINFGKKWLGIETDAKTYFEEINLIFNELANLRKASKKTQTWESLGDYHASVYVPILDAFKKELERLDKEHPEIVAKKLVEYLVGNQDFYKVIKGKHEVEIQAYNLYGTLNQPFENIKSSYKIQRLKLPNRLIEIEYQDNSKTTLNVTLTDGWLISFRIHNASSRIESSLKFDINLNANPNSLFNSKFTLGKSL